MKTDELIDRLSTSPAPAGDVRGWAFAAWLAGTGAVMALAFGLLPYRPDLHERFRSAAYAAQTALSLAGFVLASAVAYKSSLPARLTPRDVFLGWLPPLFLTAVALLRLAPHAFTAEFVGELTYRRGGCGAVIFVLGLIEACLLVLLARRGAPTRLALTAAWIAVAAGSLGLFITQFFVCYLENAAHLLVWHFAPVLLLLGVMTRWGVRWLRW